MGRRTADRHRLPGRQAAGRGAGPADRNGDFNTGCGRARAWRPRPAVRAEMGEIC
jgi:hypothetical protein